MKACEYPNVKGTTGYRNGCRCDRCRAAATLANKKYDRNQYLRKNYRAFNLPSRNPNVVRNTNRPLTTAFGGC